MTLKLTPTTPTPEAIVPPLDAADTQSANLIDGNLTQLKTLFPEAFKEGGVDFEVLKQLLGGQVDEREEKYGLNWHGKRRARQIALTPSTGTLRPCPGESVDWDTTQNLMIEGDNLEVLKLLQKSYAGKVKMIYIDPPYNTGKDFVYPDNFTDNIKNYLELTGQTDGEGRKLSSNTEASGRFHTDWLNMMYPRLKLARNLLREDGVIFISCDDTELPRIRVVLEDVFGEEAHLATFIWKSRQNKDNRTINGASIDHEYIVAFGQSIRGDSRDKTQFANPDNDARGAWASANMVGIATADRRPNLHYDLVNPSTRISYACPAMGWRYEKSTMARLIEERRVIWPANDDGRPRRKAYLNEFESDFTGFSTLIGEGIFTKHGTAAVEELFETRVFDFPKPIALLESLTEQASKESDIVLDFFAGSGTSGHAVMCANQTDGHSRRYILVQLPEQLHAGNPEQKTAADFCDKLGKPRNIAELTKERLRRSATKIGAAYARNDSATAQLSLENEPEKPTKPLDLGFKVFKLDTSNIRAWNPNPDELADTLMAHTEHLAAGRTEADVLYEVLLKQGLDLALPVQRQVIAGHAVYSVGAGALLVCLARDVMGQGDTSTGSVRTEGRSVRTGEGAVRTGAGEGTAQSNAESIKAMSESTVTAANAEALALGMANWHTQLAAALGQTPAELHTRVVLRDSLFDGDVAKTNLTAILRQRGLEDVRSL